MPDIAIVGGGPSGLALAAICERRGLSYIVYERSARDTPPRGGCLDLHVGSGQRAMKEAGVFETFKKKSRADDASIHRVYDHKGNYVFSWGEGRDSPEIDRHDIKETLLSGVPAGKVLWRKKLETAERDETGKIVLKFEDGAVEGGFRLVVGADGTHSKIRPLVTSATPHHYGVIFFETAISPSNPFYKTIEKEAGEGPLVVMGRETAIWVQIQGTGRYNCGFGVSRSTEWLKGVDESDFEGTRKLLLSDEFFGEHSQLFKDILKAVDVPFRAWPLWEMPPEALNWEPSSDVTLIGDSAHTTTPFIGDGANCAMRDAVILADKIQEYGFGRQAIATYEQEMFVLAQKMIMASHFSGKLFFAPDSPAGFVKEMHERPFIGESDGY